MRNSRIRLVPWVSDGEARVRPGVKNAWLRNPAVRDAGDSRPLAAGAIRIGSIICSDNGDETDHVLGAAHSYHD